MGRFGEYQGMFFVAVLVAILIGAVGVFSAIWPRYEEYFFEMGILGENKKAEHYYPNNSPTIGINVPVRWYIYINNHMGSPQNVSIRVKLLNSTQPIPDERRHEPSPVHPFVELNYGLSTDENQSLSFSWYVSEADYIGGSVVITQLTLNNRTLGVNTSSKSSRFRLVFELWVYNQTSRDFQFYWKSKQEYYSLCLWMWFNVNATLPES